MCFDRFSYYDVFIRIAGDVEDGASGGGEVRRMDPVGVACDAASAWLHVSQH